MTKLSQLTALELLNPDFSPQSRWSSAHRAQDEQQTRALFIQELRNGASRFPASINLVNLSHKRLGMPIYYPDGHRYNIQDLSQLRYTGAYGITHQFQDQINWKFDPTEHSGNAHTREWTVQMNRHYQWIVLADAYRETPSPEIAHCWRNELVSWCNQQPCPSQLDLHYKNGWRTIDVAIRSGWTWPYAFDVFRTAPEISDEDLWLMFTTWYQHGLYLLLNPTSRNFKSMENNGLAWTGMTFPELALAPTFLSCALDRLMAEQTRQFTEDHFQDELAPAYGILTIANLYSCVMAVQTALQNNPQHHGFLHTTKLEIPDTLWHFFDKQFTALETLADPSGNLPPLHDSSANSVNTLRETYPLPESVFRKQESSQFQSSDSSLNSNPWTIFPYAGYAIQKFSDTQFLFDFGPWGTGHQHSDIHTILLYEKGQPRIVELGRPVYDNTPISEWLRSSRSHNVISQDSLPHYPKQLIKKAYSPIPHDHQKLGDWTLFTSGRHFHSYTPGFKLAAVNPFSWTRLIVHVPQTGWLVVDWARNTASRPSHWQSLWQLNADSYTDCEITRGQVCVQFKDPYQLNFHLPQSLEIHAEILSGQTHPQIAGWVLEGKQYQPSPTLVLKSAQAATTSILATFISSSEQIQPVLPESLILKQQEGEWEFQWQTPHQPQSIRFSGDPFQQLHVENKNSTTTLEQFFLTDDIAEQLGPRMS